MKNYFLRTLIIAIAALGVLTVQSCNPDGCLNDCNQNGTCIEGDCFCDDGWMGANCDIPDPCFENTCNDNGVCLDGSCVCDVGYDGTDCNIIIRSLFTGVYDVEEICDTDPNFTDTYTSSINESIEGVQFITISNLYNFGSFDDVTPEDATVLASVSNIGGTYSVLIESQRFEATSLQDFEIAGSGTYDPATSVITLEYSITDTVLDPFDPAYIDNCVQAYYPQ